MRPVLRSGLVAVHADAVELAAMGSDAVDDGLRVALPVQARALDGELVTLQSQRLGPPVLGAAAGADGEEAHDEPATMKVGGPCECAVGLQTVGQVDETVGAEQLLLIIYRCAVAVDIVRHEAGFRLPCVYAGTGGNDDLADVCRLTDYTEVTGTGRREGDGLLLHAAQVAIAWAQVAHLAVCDTVVGGLEHPDGRQFAEAAAKEARRVGLGQRLMRGRHLHR